MVTLADEIPKHKEVNNRVILVSETINCPGLIVNRCHKE